MVEVLLNVTPFPNPSPGRNPGGDCFACSLTAAMRYLFPERLISFDDAYGCFLEKHDDGKEYLRNTWWGMRQAMYQTKDLGYDIEVFKDLVTPTFDRESHSHAWWKFQPDGEWSYRLEAWLSAGWVALAEMDSEGKGPFTSEGYHNHINHFVVLDGIRHYWKPSENVKGASSLDHDVHVVCSRKGAYWIPVHDLLHKHGTAGLWLLRRDNRR